MMTLALDSPGKCSILKTAIPQISNGEILLKVKACGVCGTDLYKYLHGTAPTGTVLGHEITGEVVKTGSSVKNIKVKDRVSVLHHIPCFVCDECRHGNQSLCEDFKKTNIYPGGFSEFVRVSEESVKKGTVLLPKEVTLEAGTLIEPCSCCLRAINRTGMRPGDTVAIIGAGPIGLINMELARILGCGKIIVLDVSPKRLEILKRMNGVFPLNAKDKDVSNRVRQITNGKGANLVIVCVGKIEAINLGISLLSKGGKLNIFAECPPESMLSIDPNFLYHSEISFIGCYSSSPLEQKVILALMESGRLQLDYLITHRFPLKSGNSAFKLALNPKKSLKILILP